MLAAETAILPAGWAREVARPPGAPAPLTDPTRAYLGSLSPKGRQTMVERLRAVAALIGVPYEAVVWHEFRFQHVDFIRQRLLDQGRSPATVNLTLAALRGIARYARNLNLMSADDATRAVRQGRQGTPGPAGGRRGRRCRGLAVAARRARGAAPLQW